MAKAYDNLSSLVDDPVLLFIAWMKGNKIEYDVIHEDQFHKVKEDYNIIID